MHMVSTPGNCVPVSPGPVLTPTVIEAPEICTQHLHQQPRTGNYMFV